MPGCERKVSGGILIRQNHRLEGVSEKKEVMVFVAAGALLADAVVGPLMMDAAVLAEIND